jgi:hypothetical protein
LALAGPDAFLGANTEMRVNATSSSGASPLSSPSSSLFSSSPLQPS